VTGEYEHIERGLGTLLDVWARVVGVFVLVAGSAWGLPILWEHEEWILFGAIAALDLSFMLVLANHVQWFLEAIRGPGGKLALARKATNAGEPFEGHVLLPKGSILTGVLRVRLVCDISKNNGEKWSEHWVGEQRVRPDDTLDGPRVQFSIPTQPDSPATGPAKEPWTSYQWRLEVLSGITGNLLCEFDVRMYGPLSEAGRAFKAATAPKYEPGTFARIRETE
jgi:hypothetical protein